MTLPRGRRANAIPGDTLREMVRPTMDRAGRMWPTGTLYQPLAAGMDNAPGCEYAAVSIGGLPVTFLGVPRHPAGCRACHPDAGVRASAGPTERRWHAAMRETHLEAMANARHARGVA